MRISDKTLAELIVWLGSAGNDDDRAVLLRSALVELAERRAKDVPIPSFSMVLK